MYKVKIYKSIFEKHYFWYLRRCLQDRQKMGFLDLEILEGSFFEEHDHAYELIYINDYPIFIDLRDCFTIDKNLFGYFSDFLLLKANYSSELWDMAEKGKYLEGFSYRLKEQELKHRKHIKPFVLGRTFMPGVTDEFIYSQYEQLAKYDVLSYSGVGILKLHSESRLKVYDLFDKIFKDKAKLVYSDKTHFVEREKVTNLDFYLNKYKVGEVITKGFNEYINFLSLGKYSINFAGIALSTPFRLIDGVIANRCSISTKIYHDIYKTFPCVELPICGYLGTGDWVKAEEILKQLDKVNYDKMLKDSKNWYSWFLSAKGMWENQILRCLKEKKNV